MRHWLYSLIIALAITGLLLIPGPVDVGANDWLDGYIYRKQINITGSAGAGTDYKMPLLTVYKDGIYTYGSDFLNNGTATADSNGTGHPAEDAFDNNETSYWDSEAFGWPHWIKYDLGVGITKQAEKLRINPHFLGPMGALRNFTLQGSNDDANWTNITSQEAANNADWQEWEFTNNNTYRYYRIWVTSNWFPAIPAAVIDEIEMMELDILANESAGQVFLANLSASFPDDIRFCDDDGSTALNHNIVGSDADLAKFCVQPTDDVGSNQSIYIYFGKSGVGNGTSEFRENFTGYTETDPNNHITKTAYHADHDAYDNDEAYLYNTTNLTAFEHYITIQGSHKNNTAHGFPWVMTNDIDDVKGLHDGAKTYLRIMLYAVNAGTMRIQLAEEVGGVVDKDTYDGSYNKSYYMTVNKADTNLSCGIYSDAVRETTVDTLDVTLNADHNFTYSFAANTWNDGTTEHINVDDDNYIFRWIINPEPAWGIPGPLEIRERCYGYVIG